MLKVVAGAVFDIALGCSPSTGYMWQPNPLPDGVVLLGSEFAAPANAQVGDAGQQVFHLRAERAGHYTLMLVLKRRWEAEPIETHTVDLIAS